LVNFSESMNRREFIAALGASSIAATRASATTSTFLPEAFGAVGDGKTDDYAAFQRLVAAVNGMASGTVSFTRGRTYFLDRHVTAGNGISDPIFSGCNGLAIEGNGATFAVKGDFHRETSSTRSLCGLRFEDCANVMIRNVELVGNVQLMSRTPKLAEAPSHGLLFGGCSDVTVDGVISRHFAADGMYVRASARPDVSGRYRASRRFHVRNSRFLFNARQGLSVIQLRDGAFENCDFSFTGSIDESGRSSPYGAHAPVAGVDIEPNSAPWYERRPVDVLTGNLSFRSSRMIGNLGGALVAGQVNGDRSMIENVIVERCVMRTSRSSPSRYGLIFDVPGGVIRGCTIDLADKTAFIGWYKQSRANPVISGNTISGERPPILVVRMTNGAPTVEGNRLIGPGKGQAGGLVQIENPRAVVRDNIMK
jgi:hypothetical protein